MRHVIDQENYFREMDAQFEAYETDQLEDVQFGSLEDLLAPDVALAQFQNPSCKTYISTFFINTSLCSKNFQNVKLRLDFVDI